MNYDRFSSDGLDVCVSCGVIIGEGIKCALCSGDMERCEKCETEVLIREYESYEGLCEACWLEEPCDHPELKNGTCLDCGEAA